MKCKHHTLVLLAYCYRCTFSQFLKKLWHSIDFNTVFWLNLCWPNCKLSNDITCFSILWLQIFARVLKPPKTKFKYSHSYKWPCEWSKFTDQYEISQRNINLESKCTCVSFFLATVLSWSYGSWIYNYNYLCNQCLSPLTWVRIPLGQGVLLNTTLCDTVCQWLAAGGRFLRFPPPIKLTGHRHNITEILLKVALNTITLTLYNILYIHCTIKSFCRFISSPPLNLDFFIILATHSSVVGSWTCVNKDSWVYNMLLISIKTKINSIQAHNEGILYIVAIEKLWHHKCN